MKKVAIVIGTRPEAIKMTSIVMEGLKRDGVNLSVWNTGQHRDLVRPVLNAFGISADCDLGLMSGGQSPAAFFAKAITAISAQIRQSPPDLLFVQGDTATAAAASVAAFFEKVPIAHVEAGLRTGDLAAPWPEEYNRRLISISADWNFAPTEKAKNNLLAEGTPAAKIHVTGNTGIDALLIMVEKLRGAHGDKFLQKWGALDPAKPTVLCTFHRREAFGTPLRLVMRALLELAQEGCANFILPLHPNPEVRKASAEILGSPPRHLFLTEPLDYEEFVWLMDKSALLITDSGGVQEEAPTLGKAVLVTREKTERPEAVEAGSARLVGTDPAKIVSSVRSLLSDANLRGQMAVPRFVFGDGKAASRIWDQIQASPNFFSLAT